MNYKWGTDRHTFRILMLLGMCLLFLRVPAAAQRMGSVDVNGSEVAYQAQYDAYTEAASQDGAVVCKLTVGNPTAGTNGALARVIMPDGKNVYLYMDAGALCVMRFDGSEYKKFKAGYQLKKDTTYTLCVFQDGLVFLDGVSCYTYSGDFYGFSDVAAGWSDTSNVFSTSLKKENPLEATAGDEQETESEDPAGQTSAGEVSTGGTAAAVVASFPSFWVILVMLLAVTSNLVALSALRTSNIALRAIHPNKLRTSKQTAAAPQKQASRKPATQRTSRQQHTQSQPAKQQPRRQHAAPQNRSTARPSARPQQSAQTRTAKQTGAQLFDQAKFAQMDAAGSTAKAAARKQGTMTQPFDLYADDYWRANPTQLVSYRFGSLNRGYCVFERGTEISRDPFVMFGDGLMWLNPVRFHPYTQDHGVPISMTECSELSMAYDFCHVGTGEREIALSIDVEMVNFRPAHVKQSTGGTWELEERGIIVFE